MIRTGVIGVGLMGSDHNTAIKKLSEKKDIQVAAIADCRSGMLKKAAELWPEAALYPDAMELIQKEDLDAVHICLPSYLHAKAAAAAMEKGWNVLLEKPACLSEEECALLMETKKRTGVKVMVGQVLRFFPEYSFLKEAFDTGKYGALKGIVLQRLSQNVLWGFEDWFHDEKKSGSVVLDLHIHDADFVRFLLGEPEGIHVSATAYEDGMINQILTQYDYPGILVSAEGVWDITEKIPFSASFRAYFEEATVTFSGRETPSLRVWKKDGTVEEPQLAKAPVLGGYYTEIEYFYDCLEKGAEPERASLEEGIRTVQLVLRELREAHRFLDRKSWAAKESSMSRRVVK